MSLREPRNYRRFCRIPNIFSRTAFWEVGSGCAVRLPITPLNGLKGWTLEAIKFG
jgi:hypothetical protein